MGRTMNSNWQRFLSSRWRRRSFLLASGSLVGAIACNSRSRAIAQPNFNTYPFQLGVASGDPLDDSVVIWTRLAPNPLQPTSMPAVNVPVQWQVATDETMTQVVQQGEAIATPEFAHSVHVVVEGLNSDRPYWYRFRVADVESPIGRTKTLPAVNSSPDALEFAFVSCQNYEHGYFTALRHLAAEDLDFVFHLGDYIYEYEYNPESNPVRRHIGPEPTDLDSYRLRFALYKTDPDLQAAHAAFPFICTWDDHEVENDYADAESENFDPPAEFLRRRAAAYQAYYEHLPLRPWSRPQGANLRLYRCFNFGDLAQFHVLDTRQYRSDQSCDNNGKGGGQLISIACEERLNRDRTMLGRQQEQWLYEGLDSSNARWNVIAQQYLVSQLQQMRDGEPFYWSDSWDGYPISRQRLLDYIAQRQVTNPVFIGGDIHSFWVSDLKADFDNPDSPIVASEFVCTSISSRSIPHELFAEQLEHNPHIKYFESRLRGYVRCHLDREIWQSDLRVVETVEQPNAPVRTLASYGLESGKPGVRALS